MFIYKITNLVTGKLYIGRTTRNVEERWEEHKRKAIAGESTHFYEAIRRDGSENFLVETIYETQDLTDLIEKEEYYIKQYNTYNKGYNMTKGGEWDPMECSISKDKHDQTMKKEETRAKISQTMSKYRIENAGVDIYRDRTEKRVSITTLPLYLNQGWKKGRPKGRVYINKDGYLKRIWPEELESYLEKGWLKGKILDPTEVKISKLHFRNKKYKYKRKDVKINTTKKFKEEQSHRLKDYYKNNPHWKTKSKHAVIIENPDTHETLEFESCLALVRAAGIPESWAYSGTIKKWVELGFIKHKKCVYNNWFIKYK